MCPVFATGNGANWWAQDMGVRDWEHSQCWEKLDQKGEAGSIRSEDLQEHPSCKEALGLGLWEDDDPYKGDWSPHLAMGSICVQAVSLVIHCNK